MSFILACGQFTPKPADVAANIRIMQEEMKEASAAGAQMMVFPELCLSGYISPEQIAPLAIRADGGELEPLRQSVRQLGLDIAFGFAEAAPDGSMYNSMLYMNSQAEVVHTYRKVHLWDTERTWATPGDSFQAFDTANTRCGMWICYDTRFPEAARLLAIDGACCGLVATAWLGPAAEWRLQVRARATDNGMYVAASAIQGVNESFTFHGGSLIVDPHGRVLAEAEEGADQVIVAEFNDDTLAAFRQRLPLLRDRRIDVYGRLLSPADW